jgi:hypothetical protein
MTVLNTKLRGDFNAEISLFENNFEDFLKYLLYVTPEKMIPLKLTSTRAFIDKNFRINSNALVQHKQEIATYLNKILYIAKQVSNTVPQETLLVDFPLLSKNMLSIELIIEALFFIHPQKVAVNITELQENPRATISDLKHTVVALARKSSDIEQFIQDSLFIHEHMVYE